MLNPVHQHELRQAVKGLNLFAALKSAVVAGALADTNIAVAGLALGDTLVSVVEHPGPGEAAGQVAVDRTAQASVFADGQLRVSVATNTTADRRLVVIFHDASA